jgi:hypothetical protein
MKESSNGVMKGRQRVALFVEKGEWIQRVLESPTSISSLRYDTLAT